MWRAACAAMLVAAPVRAQPVPEGIHTEATGDMSLCGITGADVPAIQAQFIALDGVTELTVQDAYRAFSQEEPFRVWSFTTAANPAHPAVVCRTVVEEQGQVMVQMEIACAASREACDDLFRQFEALNQRTIDSVGQ